MAGLDGIAAASFSAIFANDTFIAIFYITAVAGE